ncbi:hypothetical protein LB507_010946 [Fusarium sp. FIESC RH6]|nr:hypothetical protein LB507_010946 [Fusarium sp. FIESC RH6]
MTSETKAECSFNTSECILETIASILSEVQEKNSEYDWDPLTFVFTAIIGVIAIMFAALTALQAFLAAGPGRTKSGVYAIGPWSQFNRRKFDLAEMRFRTTSSTPILTIDSLNFDALTSVHPVQARARLRKGKDDYFPATWLALLSCLSVDNAKLWGDKKLTGADFIPSELSAVPAYGSIRFVVTLAMILSGGRGRLTTDRESGLLRVRDRRFNLIFRQHALLGAIGFFEMYGNVPFLQSSWRIELHKRLLQAYGHMGISDVGYGDGIKSFINSGEVLTFNEVEGKEFIRSFTDNVERQCPHGNQEPRAACLNVLDYVAGYHPYLFKDGPLYLLMAPTPELNVLPNFFPHTKTKLRERLDALLLQSRFWGINHTAYCDLFPHPPVNFADIRVQLTSTTASWAKSNVNQGIGELHVDEGAYKLCSAYLEQSPEQNTEYDAEVQQTQKILQKELISIDSWLKRMEPHVLCRKLTLSVIGDGIRRMIEINQQESYSEATPGTKTAAVLFSPDDILLPLLHDKLGQFLEALGKPNSTNYLSPRVVLLKSAQAVKHDVFEGLKKIQNLWELEQMPHKNKVNGREDGEDEEGEEHMGRSWKFPSATVHPLDDVLIYRAVLMTMLYCLSSDSSVLLDENAYGIIVPIM